MGTACYVFVTVWWRILDRGPLGRAKKSRGGFPRAGEEIRTGVAIPRPAEAFEEDYFSCRIQKTSWRVSPSEMATAFGGIAKPETLFFQWLA